jgi:hypothetical protein
MLSLTLKGGNLRLSCTVNERDTVAAYKYQRTTRIVDVIT